MQISICGTPGSGKSTVARIIAEKLHYKYYSVGELRRKAAEKRGLTIYEFNQLKEDTDTFFDNIQKEIGEKEDNFVIEGRLSFHFVPKSLKIFFKTDLRKAAERVFKDQRETEKTYKSVEEAREEMQERMDNDKRRYKMHYNLDPYDEKQFDAVLDTTGIAVDEVVEKVMKEVNKHREAC
ncbi:MAG: cytidylate kinase family protein [Nanoarchaeota archaeon]|nr:cytidylate kinase family protein [Nanoarchaeota archaeon]